MTTENRVNYAMKVIGNLMHDNKLFDRTCPSCEGMYSSYEVANCPKCGAMLTYITTNDGKNRAMSISEGTIGLCFGPKQEAKDAKAIKNRKNGLTPLYRFKRFSFADDNGTLPLPKDHHLMKKGAQVEITIVNHQAIPSGPFQTKKGGATIEFMMLIFDDQGYGDTVKVLRPSQAIAANVPISLDGAGQPLPVDTSDIHSKIAAMAAQIEQMKAAAMMSGPPAQDTSQPVVPVNNQAVATSAEEAVAAMDEPPFEGTAITDNSIDPFGQAS